jgi:hypothetical protein
MKQSLILLFAAFAFISYSTAQTPETYKVTKLIAGGGRSFQIIGTDSHAFVDSLFTQFSGTKRNGYTWKFRKVEIPGISKTVTLEVHQGIKGYYKKEKCDSNSCGGGSYFHAFMNEKRKEDLLNKQTKLEHPAIIIYIKRGRQYCLKTKEEAEIAEAYLRSIFEG